MSSCSLCRWRVSYQAAIQKQPSSVTDRTPSGSGERSSANYFLEWLPFQHCDQRKLPRGKTGLDVDSAQHTEDWNTSSILDAHVRCNSYTLSSLNRAESATVYVGRLFLWNQEHGQQAKSKQSQASNLRNDDNFRILAVAELAVTITMWWRFIMFMHLRWALNLRWRSSVGLRVAMLARCDCPWLPWFPSQPRPQRLRADVSHQLRSQDCKFWELCWSMCWSTSKVGLGAACRTCQLQTSPALELEEPFSSSRWSNFTRSVTSF